MNFARKPRRRCLLALGTLAALGASLWAQPASALQAFSIDAANTLTFYNINDVVGANTFYANGYTGQGAIVANIEAGLIWNGNQNLTQVTTQIPNPFASNQYDRHATWVGSTIANTDTTTGNGGLAPGVTLWSGAIATSWASEGTGLYSTSFNISGDSLMLPYVEAMLTGVNSQTADVITSSWGTGDTGSQGGNSALSQAFDSLVSQSGKTLVFSAGNSGPTTNTIFDPASGNNFIVAGATSDTPAPAYSTVASFSSVSPSDFFLPLNSSGSLGITFAGSRAVVDLVAPGTDLDLAHYGGATGGNAFGGTTDTDTNSYDYFLSGTSFAAPIIASGASLVVSVGKSLYPTDSNAIDGRIVKAVLMNSATQLPGYNNGQSLVSGVVTTTQALDYTQGAGQINLTQAWSQYTGGTHDVATPAQGSHATVQPIGWTFGNIAHGATEADRDYLINTPQTSGSTLTATVDWFSNDAFDTADPGDLETAYGDFDNLGLEVWETSGSTPTKLVAESDAPYESVQHLSFALPDNATYLIRVLEDNYVYNFDGGTNTDYGLAWAVNVPEPASTAITVLAMSAVLLRRRRKEKAPSCV